MLANSSIGHYTFVGLCAAFALLAAICFFLVLLTVEAKAETPKNDSAKGQGITGRKIADAKNIHFKFTVWTSNDTGTPTTTGFFYLRQGKKASDDGTEKVVKGTIDCLQVEPTASGQAANFVGTVTEINVPDMKDKFLDFSALDSRKPRGKKDVLNVNTADTKPSCHSPDIQNGISFHGNLTVKDASTPTP
jgi:hypothetical protein